jgi:hypothetical protein
MAELESDFTCDLNERGAGRWYRHGVGSSRLFCDTLLKVGQGVSPIFLKDSMEAT